MPCVTLSATAGLLPVFYLMFKSLMNSMKSMRIWTHLVILCGLFVFASNTSAQRITYKTRDIAVGFNVPWEMRIAPDGWLFFTERPGRISKLNLKTGQTKLLLADKDCILWHEGGMLGFDLHPKFPDSPYVYATMVYQEAPSVRSFGLFRYTYTGDTLVNRVQLFGPALALWSHNGSRVVIHDDKIYFSLGEVWQFEIAQNIASANGKINRINLDGSIPNDNPFPGLATWTFGHRNPQGLVFAPDGKLYSSEHGDVTDDEINLIEKSRNYGWPLVHGYCDSASDHPDCEDLKIREPLAAFTPTLAACDLEYFNDTTVPEWKNSLLLASLRDQSLHQFTLSDDGQAIESWERYNLVDEDGELYGRIRSICLSKEGKIYISTGNSYAAEDHMDRIFELIRTGVEPASVRLELPLNETIVSAQDVPLTWRRSYLHARYELQLASSYDFDSMSILFTQELEDSLLHIGSLNVGQRYFWRVRELLTHGPWSEVRTFVNAQSGVDSNPHLPEMQFEAIAHNRSIGIRATSDLLAAEVEVIDALGRSHERRVLNDLHPNVERSLGAFDPGVYFVRLATPKGIVTRRVLVR